MNICFFYLKCDIVYDFFFIEIVLFFYYIFIKVVEYSVGLLYIFVSNFFVVVFRWCCSSELVDNIF